MAVKFSVNRLIVSSLLEFTVTSQRFSLMKKEYRPFCQNMGIQIYAVLDKLRGGGLVLLREKVNGKIWKKEESNFRGKDRIDG